MFGRLKRRAEYLQVAAAKNKWVAPGLILQVCRHSRSSENVNATHCGGDDVLRPAVSDADSACSPSPQMLSPCIAVPMRVGFTASRKVGNAVRRNRARRRLKAAAELVVPSHGAPDHDIVLIARQATLDRAFPDLVADLARGLRKLGAYRIAKDQKAEQTAGNSSR
ncbi:ribonuclease P protein component [Dongia soli]|uniref:Ribonuclease P protein component n=1 Tax=Dongia soli TaxID=600628 RepID=A0ABU5E684_9PROT|nr:ribonuclease P protein component [Dongia soli]MDY0881654.1 ribonuclease P protein component [Dongia soli]